MKFIISRASNKRYDEKPCKIAFQVDGGGKSGKFFAVEFTTLEELVAFKVAMGCPLVLYKFSCHPKIDIQHEIVIHDRGYID